MRVDRRSRGEDVGIDALLAHRDGALRARLRSLLERAGNVVGEVDGPADAVDACREHDPDVVFLEADGGLPALDAIKHDVDEFTVAVVLVGPPSLLADSTGLMRRGAHEVLLEPVRDEDVVPRCHGAIKVRHLQEAVLDLDGTIAAVTHVDLLTGLYSRPHAFEQLTALTNSALRHDRPLSIVAVDVDQVPELDARYGTVIGDEVIKDVAACLRSRLRDEDIAARIDRQDFLVLLPETCGTDAACVAEGLRACVSSSPLLVDGTPTEITVSAGWAQLDPAAPAEFLDEVVRALDRARHGGRNRVCGPPPAADAAKQAVSAEPAPTRG